MNLMIQKLHAYIQTHPFDPGRDDCKTVLDQLFQTYQEAHDFDPPEIKAGFRELDAFLDSLCLSDNNDGFLLVCKLCSLYEQRAFSDGVLYGAHLMKELFAPEIAKQ